MTSELDLLKGIHPGLVLEKKLKEHHLKKGRFALSIDEYPQTLTAITKGKRDMNLPLALKIEQALGLEEGYFMMLQLYYDIRKEKQKQQKAKPNLAMFRKVLFWDTDIDNLDWETQSRSIIQRVFERGNEAEKQEVTRFYGSDRIQQVLSNTNGS